MGLGLETPGEITSGAKHAAQRKTRVDRFGPSALGWYHPVHSLPLRTTRVLTIGGVQRRLRVIIMSRILVPKMSLARLLMLT